MKSLSDHLRLVLIYLLLLLISPLSKGAKWSTPRENQPSFKFGIISATLQNTFRDQKDQNLTSIDYEPNSVTRLLVGVTYLGYSLSGSFASRANEKSILSKGETKGADYQFRFFKEQNTFDIYYQKYQGYYIKNSSEIDPQYVGQDSYMQRPDMHTEHYGGQYFRSLNPEEFSLSACFEQNGWQKESGGTWFYYGGFDIHHIDADTTLIPNQLMSIYSSIHDFKRGDFTTLKLGFGGAYALVFNNFFLATQLIFAGGQQKQVYLINSNQINKIIPTNGLNVKVGLGYNGDKFYSSLNFFNDSTALNIEDKKIDTGTAEATLVFGVHL